jgi:hypothetical protein
MPILRGISKTSRDVSDLLFGHIRMIDRKQKMQGTLIAEFREFIPTRKDPAKFIDTELPPYADAYEEVTDKAFQSFKNVEETNRRLVSLSRVDNFDWQPPAIEVIARHRADPEFTLRFLSDLERLAYGYFSCEAILRIAAPEARRDVVWRRHLQSTDNSRACPPAESFSGQRMAG